MTNLKAFGLTLLLSAVILAAMHLTGTGDPMIVGAPSGSF